MSRGRFPARLRVAAPDEAVAARYLLTWSNRELYRHPEHFTAISAESLLEMAGPLALEIGSATGEFLVETAARRPACAHLGIDIVRKPLFRAVELARSRNLANIRFLQADMKLLYALLATESLGMVYVHFPVPPTTARHRKRWVLAPPYLAQLHRALRPEGRISILTDNELAFRELQQNLQTFSGFEQLDPNEYSFVIDEALKSPHHRRWEAQQRPIFRCELVKQN
jgi:tRNA (guanine-N7-)-methyltransferase